MSLQVEEADYSQSGLVAGRSITVVKTPDRYEEAIDILRENGTNRLFWPVCLQSMLSQTRPDRSPAGVMHCYIAELSNQGDSDQPLRC